MSLPAIGSRVTLRLGNESLEAVVLEHRGALGPRRTELIRVAFRWSSTSEDVEVEVPLEQLS